MLLRLLLFLIDSLILPCESVLLARREVSLIVEHLVDSVGQKAHLSEECITWTKRKRNYFPKLTAQIFIAVSALFRFTVVQGGRLKLWECSVPTVESYHACFFLAGDCEIGEGDDGLF